MVQQELYLLSKQNNHFSNNVIIYYGVSGSIVRRLLPFIYLFIYLYIMDSTSTYEHYTSMKFHTSCLNSVAYMLIHMINSSIDVIFAGL